MRNLSRSLREAWKSDGKGTFRKYRPQSRLAVELQPRLALPRLVHAVGVRDLVCMRRALATKDVASARPLSTSWLSQAVAIDSSGRSSGSGGRSSDSGGRIGICLSPQWRLRLLAVALWHCMLC